MSKDNVVEFPSPPVVGTERLYRMADALVAEFERQGIAETLVDLKFSITALAIVALHAADRETHS